MWKILRLFQSRTYHYLPQTSKIKIKIISNLPLTEVLKQTRTEIVVKSRK